MLLYPASRTTSEYQTLLNLRMSHKKINPISNANKMGKPRPRTAITQELAGLM
jgi:hypothetical protein